MRHRRLASLLGALALFGAGSLLASCGGEDSAAETTETVVDTTTTIPPSTTTTSTPPSPPGPIEIRIVVVDGVPTGGIVRETVEKSDRVVLIVRSDVSDHVHVHGYDLMRNVAPGTSVRLPFRAAIPGRFEVELEDRGVQIAEITVRP